MSDHDAFTIEHGHGDYTDAELLEQARGNAQALLLATAAFLAERGVDPAAWAAALGARFALGWGKPRPWDAGEFLDAMLTNYRALGATVEAVELGVERAEATVAGFPDPALCALFAVPAELAAAFHGVAAPIARDRGLRWAWEREGDGVRLRVRLLVERAEE